MQTDFIKSSAPEAWDLQGTGSAAGAGGGSSSAGSAVNTQDTSQNFAGFTDIGSGFEGGNVLFRNSGYLRLGQGDDSVIFDANDALYRVAVGSETYAIAPFRVQKDGKFHAGSSTQYIDWDGTKLTIAGDVVQIDTSTGAVKGSLQNVLSLTAGETISGATTPVPVYLASDGKVYKADADSTTPEARCVLGFCITDATANNSATIQTDGILTVPTITLSETVTEYADQYMENYSSGYTINSTAVWYSIGFTTGQNQGNISKVQVANNTSSGTLTVVAEIYAMDATGRPTGSTLGTSNGKSTPISLGFFDLTFSSPVTVTPGTNYCLVIRLSSYTSGSFSLGVSSGAFLYDSCKLPYPTTCCWSSTNSGSTWTNQYNNDFAFKIFSTSSTSQIGYPIYLSSTAGQYSIKLNSTQDSNHFPLGTINSSTSIKLNYLPGKLIKYHSVGIGSAVNSPTSWFYVPKFTRMVIISFRWDGDSASPTNRSGQITLTRGECTSQTIYDDTGGATEPYITFDWYDGIIKVVNNDATSAQIAALKCYFYS